MGFRKTPRPWDFPRWAETVGAMVESGCVVQVWCDRCRVHQRVDLVALLAKVGPDYSLCNRRCRCRLTEGCTGWNSFSYLHGVMRPLSTSEVRLRWMLG